MSRFFAANAPEIVYSLGVIGLHCVSNRQHAAGDLCSLTTSTLSVAESNSVLKCAPRLSIGTLVVGIDAAVISYCAARNIPAVCLIIVTSASLDVHTYCAMEAVLPLLRSTFLPTDAAVAPIATPSKTLYRQAVRDDPFLSNTENLYT